MNKIIIFVLSSVLALPTTFAADFTGDADLAKIRVIGVSNFIEDHIHEATSKFISDNGLEEGNTVIITTAHKETLFESISTHNLKLLKQNPGGAVANTLVGLNYLGLAVGAIGSSVDDIPGRAYVTDLTQKGIKCRVTEAPNPERGSGACYIFVTETESTSPDGTISKKKERTMGTSLGVTIDVHLSQEDINWVSSADLFLAEGYLFCPTAYQSMRDLALATKNKGKLVALSIAAGFCATTFNVPINNFIKDYADIVLGDNSEAKILTGATDTIEAVIILQSMGKIGAVTCGTDGAYVFDHTHIYLISKPTVDSDKIVDATGAGDQFAAGFLYEILQSGDIIRAGQLGAFCAGEVIQVLGGHPPASLAEKMASGAPWLIEHSVIP
jgi:sugar/nucleoside kinase (ribokinase family)